MTFSGFPKQTMTFLSGLSRNNEKAWFDAHREAYDAHFIEPAKSFVEAMAPRLEKIDPNVNAEPRVNGSIMRINRDVRFSKDKSPYKDHLDLWFWTGEKKGWDNPGFFFRLTPKKLMLGAGMHGFMPEALAKYRAAVLDDAKGAALTKVVAKLRKLGYEVGGETFKKTPRDVDAEHPRAALAKHSGLYAAWESKHPKELATAALPAFVAKHYAAVAPINVWLAKM
jgi:uncharacterized protein (TIGR02453 family)